MRLVRMAGALVAAVTAGVVVPAAGAQPKLRGEIRIDGSSTVAPISIAAAELFAEEQPRVDVHVGVSGTGGGFQKFLADRADLRTDINGASRPIKPEEVARAERLGVQFIELPIAYDGIAVVVNPANDFVEQLTVDDLRRLWAPDSPIQRWSQVRGEFPDVPLKLYGPGSDSGTFDYFTEVVVGRAKASRSDYTASEDDNVLVQGVAGDRGALGYFGFSYYQANRDKLRLVPIVSAEGKAVAPDAETIGSGAYDPLSRPLFLYVNAESAQRPEVREFVRFVYLQARTIVEHPQVSYVGLGGDLYEAIWRRFEQRTTGSVFAGPDAPDGNVRSLAERYGLRRRAD